MTIEQKKEYINQVINHRVSYQDLIGALWNCTLVPNWWDYLGKKVLPIKEKESQLVFDNDTDDWLKFINFIHNSADWCEKGPDVDFKQIPFTYDVTKPQEASGKSFAIMNIPITSIINHTDTIERWIYRGMRREDMVILNCTYGDILYMQEELGIYNYYVMKPDKRSDPDNEKHWGFRIAYISENDINGLNGFDIMDEDYNLEQRFFLPFVINNIGEYGNKKRERH